MKLRWKFLCYKAWPSSRGPEGGIKCSWGMVFFVRVSGRFGVTDSFINCKREPTDTRAKTGAEASLAGGSTETKVSAWPS